jgi:hypothetical protein
MKTIKAKKLPRRLMTITDFSRPRIQAQPTGEIGHPTDTTVTMTIIITTIATHNAIRN